MGTLFWGVGTQVGATSTSFLALLAKFELNFRTYRYLNFKDRFKFQSDNGTRIFNSDNGTRIVNCQGGTQLGFASPFPK